MSWIRRARPPRRDLASAITAGVVAAMANVALLVGAVALLVESAVRPGLQAVLGVLIVIELLAFLRSPLRFAERMSAHRLGYQAVSHWRGWLLGAISALSYRRWRTFAAGDLLERSLRDTDELQDLWLRAVLPFLTSIVALGAADIVVAVLTPHWRWPLVAALLLAIQVVAITTQAASVPGQLREDRALRTARAAYRTQLIELGTVAPEMSLLNRGDVITERSHVSEVDLERAERALVRRRRLSNAIAPAAAILCLLTLEMRPTRTPLWSVVTAMIAVSTLDLLNVTRSALETAVSVIGGTQRLDELAGDSPRHHLPWPDDETLRIDRVSVAEGDTVLLEDATFTVARGERVAITGTSGAGKSTLLRIMANLDQAESGRVAVGDTRLDEIDGGELRRHLSYVPSDPGLLRGFAVDVVTLGRPATRDLVSDLRALHLDAEATTRWEGLSRGEGERVAIVRALLTSPSILILDEPTSGLGARETSAVLDLLSSTGASIVIATHDPDVMAWCDRTLSIEESSLVVLSR